MPYRRPHTHTPILPPDALVLHTHLGMPGSWHLYRPGEAWQKPARRARVTLYTDEFVAPCFNAPAVELLGSKRPAAGGDGEAGRAVYCLDR